jgi:alkaline phosphatase
MKHNLKFLVIALFSSITFAGACQQTQKDPEFKEAVVDNSKAVYQNSKFHEVNAPPVSWSEEGEVKNVILMIGDGMGTAQVFAGIAANKGKLNIINFPHSGFVTTHAKDSDITDSAAGATALASGVKTNNRAIGVDSDGAYVETILEMAENAGLATGLVVTSSLTDATPASFIAHQKQRSMVEEIASDFIETDIDVFIGGGRNNFTTRKDKRDLIDELISNEYSVVTHSDSLSFVSSGKLAGLIYEEDPPRYSEGRGNMLESGTQASLKLLSQDPDGFFLMIEGSQIDWGGHDNNTGYIVEEMLDFDRAVGIVLDFAVNNPGTLVIVTADHETGGFSIVDVDRSSGKVEGAFSTGDHTGVMVPVYAYGPQSNKFSGTYDNTDIFYKMKDALGF